jgi:hypothetical protein
MYNRRGMPMNPYLAGSLAGALSVLSTWFTGKYFGASTSFVRSAGFVEKIFSPEKVAQMPYFMKEIPQIDWQFMFVIGIFLGSLVSSLFTKTYRVQWVPITWRDRFGKSSLRRAVTAFVGGIIAMFGARLADG